MGFLNVKLIISCFHKKLIKQVLVSDPWHHKVASWAPGSQKRCVLHYFWMHEGDGWKDFGPHGGVADQPELRVRSDFARKMNVWCVSGFGLGAKLG